MDDLILRAAEAAAPVGGLPGAFGLLVAGGLACGLWVFQGRKLLLKWKCRHIPVPPGEIPFVGHALDLLAGNVWGTFTEWGRRFGGLYRVTVMNNVYVAVDDPVLIKQIMQGSIHKYRKDKANYYVFGCLLGKGIVTSEGERWQGLRRQLAPTFKLEILESVGSAAVDVTKRLFATLDDACTSETEVDMSEEFRKITLQVISLAVLGIEPNEADKMLSCLYLPIIDECNDRIWYPHRRFLPLPSWFRHQYLVDKLNSYLEGKIMSRWNEKFAKGEYKGEPRDILDRILASEDRERFLKGGLQELRDGLKTMLFAGHDTTSCMLTWALWELMNSPEDVKICVREADETFKSGYAVPFASLRSSFMHTFNVLRETLRIYSVVPIVTRELAEDDELGGVAVPKGCIIVCNLRSVHHREDLWPDAEKFRPQRFGVASTTSPMTGLGEGVDPWAFLPFINGPRNCLGQHFSLLESRVIIGMLLQRYEFSPARGQDNKAHAYKIPITPDVGMRCTVKRR